MYQTVAMPDLIAHSDGRFESFRSMRNGVVIVVSLKFCFVKDAPCVCEEGGAVGHVEV